MIRARMTYRAILLRNSATAEDDYGTPVPPTFIYESTIPCFFGSRDQRAIGLKDNADVDVVVQDLWIVVPRDTDITILDRIENITDRQNNVKFTGPFLIDTISEKIGYLKVQGAWRYVTISRRN